MRLILALLATALLALAALSAKGAPADEANLDLRRSMGNLRPYRSNDRPAPPGRGVDCGRIEHGTFKSDCAGKYPYYGDAYWHGCYRPPHDYPYYVYPRRCRWRYPYFAPIYIPAETMYGPQALKRFLGVHRVNYVGRAAGDPPIGVFGRGPGA